MDLLSGPLRFPPALLTCLSTLQHSTFISIFPWKRKQETISNLHRLPQPANLSLFGGHLEPFFQTPPE
ncbi:hypothetical protein CRENBAI_007665 [Crenichthys baileyi]|uniref:Uncharacterized protein n=1 Tax=Crenichthys baileyi TaxID=28760 RepID=A0AAV9RMJ9_9TELE